MTDSLEARIRRADKQALAEYLEQVRGPLLAYIERQLGAALRRKVEPEDLLQEVSVACLRALETVQFQDDHDPFRWLCEMAQRRIVDAHRKHISAQKRSADRELNLAGGGDDSASPGLIQMLVASITSPSRAMSRNLREARLQEALQQLPDEAREALRLRYVENLPSKQIAEQLGKSDGAVRVLLTRSLKKLHELLGEADV